MSLIHAKNIKVIAFDADDTLWVNEPYFREAESQFAKLLSVFETENKIHQELYKKEIGNIPIYGYGVKAFILSMIECGIEVSQGRMTAKMTHEILEIGKAMLQKPIELLDGIQEVLEQLSKKYKLIVATKGDLLDQENKLEKSNLLKYFHHVEVMSEKTEKDYEKLVKHLDITPNDFLMIGNSLKSDILPLINIGANAVHIPFHTTWEFEKIDDGVLQDNSYITLSSCRGLLDLL